MLFVSLSCENLALYGNDSPHPKKKKKNQTKKKKLYQVVEQRRYNLRPIGGRDLDLT